MQLLFLVLLNLEQYLDIEHLPIRMIFSFTIFLVSTFLPFLVADGFALNVTDGQS